MISTIIPVYNEAQSLATLYGELDGVARANGYDLDIVFVDDGSNDGSWDEIQRLAHADPRVSGIRFRRNFGKAAALTAGFKVARGQLFVTMDADLQDDPQEIPRFLAAMNTGLDVVSGWKKVRHDPIEKVGPSRIFNALVSWLTGVKLHDHNCGFKCYRREVFDEVRIYGELHRFVPVLAAARGWKVGEIVVNHRARQHGVSKYGFRRYIKGFLDLLTVYFLTGYGHRPQHLMGTIGIGSFLCGLFGLIYLTALWFLTRVGFDFKPLHERPALIYSMGALLFGAQVMSLGFLAELFTAHYSRDSSTYSIQEQTRTNPTANVEHRAENDASNRDARANGEGN